jgi:hypothetical protein
MHLIIAKKFNFAIRLMVNHSTIIILEEGAKGEEESIWTKYLKEKGVEEESIRWLITPRHKHNKLQ